MKEYESLCVGYESNRNLNSKLSGYSTCEALLLLMTCVTVRGLLYLCIWSGLPSSDSAKDTSSDKFGLKKVNIYMYIFKLVLKYCKMLLIIVM